MVMAAIVGAAGMVPTLAAARPASVLLANKEALVMSGALFMRSAAGGATLLPIDSEHNAIFQALPATLFPAGRREGRSDARILLTASGGPFRHKPSKSSPP